MKKLIPIFQIIAMVFLTSCTNDGPPGPVGPRGYEGPTGPQGEPGESGFVYEDIITFDTFNEAGTELEVILEHPIEVLTSDVVLVYFLWGSYETDAGEVVEIWRQLPQWINTANGTIAYNFDFTIYDMRYFLQADFSYDLLESIDTDDWVARVVVVPAEFVNTGRIDFSSYQSVKEALGLPELDKPAGALQRRN